MKPYFSVFGKTIPFYGLFYFIGIGVAATVALLLRKKSKISAFDLVCSAVYTMIGAIFGAKLLFLLVSMEQIIELKLSFEAILKGGFVFYGGLIGGALGLFVYVKQFKLKFFDYFDLYAVVLPLGHAFGRVGCFTAGCCYGIPYDGFGSYTYRYAADAATPIGVPLLPIQLIEACCLFILFIVLLIFYAKKHTSKGFCLTVYACSYSILRILLEFFRGDKERGLFFGISTSQWISLLLFIGILTFRVVIFMKNRKNG